MSHRRGSGMGRRGSGFRDKEAFRKATSYTDLTPPRSQSRPHWGDRKGMRSIWRWFSRPIAPTLPKDHTVER